MTLLAVGASYRSAPVSVLERLAVDPADQPRILTSLLARPHVDESVVLSTCNRVEVYAVVTGFHAGLADVCEVLRDHSGVGHERLAEHLYVHHDHAAVTHAFSVAAGLDSMVVGEAQILGQLRAAYRVATETDTAGRLLHELMQQALRVGKRARSETAIDRAGRSTVTAALEVAAGLLPGGLAGRPALVVGAGAMGSLALAALDRAGAGPLRVANRDGARAARLAEAYAATPATLDALPELVADADLVVAATAADTPVLDTGLVASALARRTGRDGPLVLLDVAVPRDVAPDVGRLPGVVVVDIDGVGRAAAGTATAADEAAVRRIMAEEVESFLTWQRGAEVGPTVAALRVRADQVVTAELRRLRQRSPDLSERQRADVVQAMHRVVQQLLHPPTVRMRQLAAAPGGDRYATVLSHLFGLDDTASARVGEVPLPVE
ncbi:glutamyl-tRNA reductase [Micromonospora nigra]|uniref:Glutamyl-tRNA reductase n=1 Tax=Micromonospora nigra TaxID=145857 RepID=A0A1C6SYN2_9ACTN|nr:glutamyl-tRNA reductase [Micromonospora nigra]SCL34422.1 glutamyl-tRNA reductase [Micromonospora nigra]